MACLHVCLCPVPRRRYKKTSLQPNKLSVLLEGYAWSIQTTIFIGPSAGHMRAPDTPLHCCGPQLVTWGLLTLHCTALGRERSNFSSYHVCWRASAVVDPSILDVWLMHWAIFYEAALNLYPGRRQRKPHSMQYPGNMLKLDIPQINLTLLTPRHKPHATTAFFSSFLF